MTNPGYECCICHKIFKDWGNDPWPVVKDDDARCCDDCNNRVVLAARLAQMFSKEDNK